MYDMHFMVKAVRVRCFPDEVPCKAQLQPWLVKHCKEALETAQFVGNAGWVW